MACRIGMSSKPYTRISHWRSQCESRGGSFSFYILANNLTYEEAQARENAERILCGTGCQGAPGGQRLPGRIYTVYRVDCN